MERPGYEKETPYPVPDYCSKNGYYLTQIRKNVLFQQSNKYLVPELVEACRKGVVLELFEVQSFEPYTTMTREELSPCPVKYE